MDSPALVFLVLLGVGFATYGEPCFQCRHFDCAVVVAGVCLSMSSRWIVAATAPVVKVVAGAGIGFLV